MKRFFSGLVFLGTLLIMAAAVSAGKGGDGMIASGKKVSLDYTLTVDGKMMDSSQGRGPLHYTQGEGKIIPGLSRQLEGLKVGDEKNIVVSPEEAYGNVDPRAFEEVPKSEMPKDLNLTVGTRLQAKAPDGRSLLVTVSEVKKDSVLLNFNHPLAGKELHFKVKILDIQ